MFNSQADSYAAFAAAVEKARKTPEFLAEMQLVLQNALEDVNNLSPDCKACGNCCDFQAFGHRLYASTGEFACLTAENLPRQTEHLKCSWQVQNLCTARQNRPLGCRIFFCDNSISENFQQLYEKHFQIIQNMHLKYDIEYFYIELSAGISTLRNQQTKK